MNENELNTDSKPKNTYRANITSSITTMSGWKSVSKWAYLEDLLLI